MTLDLLRDDLWIDFDKACEFDFIRLVNRVQPRIAHPTDPDLDDFHWPSPLIAILVLAADDCSYDCSAMSKGASGWRLV
jgi:hypothetical protein